MEHHLQTGWLIIYHKKAYETVSTGWPYCREGGTWLDLRPLLESLGAYANIYSFVVYVIDPLFPHLRT